MSKNNEIDMLNGPLWGKLVKFAVPFAASSMLQQLFNSVDIAVVGNFASSEALAAVGANGPVVALLLNFFIGISLGTNVVIANHIGQRNENGIREAVNTSMLIAVVAGVAMMFLGLIISRPLLELMSTPDNILDQASLYLKIVLLGAPVILIYNFGAAILRSKGDTKRPLYCLIVAGILNAILNLVFVIVFHLGVIGVAIATTISNCVSAGMIVRMLAREAEPYKLHVKGMRATRRTLKRILDIGIPAGFQNMLFAISNVFVQSAINGYGSAAVAGNSAALTYEFFAYFFISAFDAAAVTFVGQNYGAGKVDRCKRIFWICLGMSAVTSGLFSLIIALNGRACLRVFTADPEVMEFGIQRFWYVMVWIFIASSYEIAGSCMRGFGYSLAPAIFVVFGTCVLRLVWIYAVSPIWPGFGHLLIAYPVSWILTGVMVVISYAYTSRKAFALVSKG